MALGDRQHVEAVAIIRNLLAALGPREDLDEYAQDCAIAGEVWLRENHPEPDVYVAALKEPLGGAPPNLGSVALERVARFLYERDSDAGCVRIGWDRDNEPFKQVYRDEAAKALAAVRGACAPSVREDPESG